MSKVTDVLRDATLLSCCITLLIGRKTWTKTVGWTARIISEVFLDNLIIDSTTPTSLIVIAYIYVLLYVKILKMKWVR